MTSIQFGLIHQIPQSHLIKAEEVKGLAPSNLKVRSGLKNGGENAAVDAYFAEITGDKVIAKGDYSVVYDSVNKRRYLITDTETEDRKYVNYPKRFSYEVKRFMDKAIAEDRIQMIPDLSAEETPQIKPERRNRVSVLA